MLARLCFRVGKPPRVAMAAVWGLLFSATACGYTIPNLGETGPIAVTVGLPLERDLVDYEDFTGRTDAVESVEIRARSAV